MQKRKEQIILHFEKTISWVEKLNHVTEDEWRTPIAYNKWTLAEIVGHFKFWDEFVLFQRLPYFFENKPLPKAPDVNLMNHQSSILSKKNSKEATIFKFIECRRNLIKAINNLSNDLWNSEFFIGDSSYILASYFESQVEHDLHHFNQIHQKLPRLSLQ
ncbi:DinB family protein [Mesobacillus zeae]|uniref:DinB family protein n=1 Tax=Mesobacillus zeae TaxID=1917180 RepID=UPI0015E6348F|nr:DinB family protein [Mesobacillus zeae]